MEGANQALKKFKPEHPLSSLLQVRTNAMQELFVREQP
jgi:hypothetical protein